MSVGGLMATNRCVLTGSEHGLRQTLGTVGRAMSSTKRATIRSQENARESQAKKKSRILSCRQNSLLTRPNARACSKSGQFSGSRVEQKSHLSFKQNRHIQRARVSHRSRVLAACLNAIGFDGSANDRRLFFEQTCRRSPSPQS